MTKLLLHQTAQIAALALATLFSPLQLNKNHIYVPFPVLKNCDYSIYHPVQSASSKQLCDLGSD
jgi:hypothetical protein